MCLSPKPIVSPLWRRMAPYADTIVLNGVSFPYGSNCTSFSVLSSYCPRFSDLAISSDGTTTNVSLLDEIISNSYGTIGDLHIPIFFAAPCSICLECRYMKRSQLCKRALFEAADYPSMYFFTLTYDDAHLPEFGLCRRDCVLAFKQFRTQLDRFLNIPDVLQGRDPISVRIWYCGEYAVKNTHRPHYHGLMFFSRHLTMSEQFRLREIFFHMKSLFRHNSVSNFWPNGYRRDFQICRSPFACARYISKYLTKQRVQDIPAGKTPAFIQGPSRNGGFGCSHIERYVDAILNSPDFTITLTDRCGGRPVRTSAPSYMLRKIFGTDLSRLLPAYNLAYYYVQRCVAVFAERINPVKVGGSGVRPRVTFACGPSDERTSASRVGVRPIAVSEQAPPQRFCEFLDNFKHCNKLFPSKNLDSWISFINRFIDRRSSFSLIDDCDYILNYFDGLDFPDYNVYLCRLKFKAEHFAKINRCSDIHSINSNKQFNHELNSKCDTFDERFFAAP